MEQSTWKERLAIELEELECRYKGLIAFMDTQRFKEIEPKQQELLLKQRYYMSCYLDILNQRYILVCSKDSVE